MSANKKYSYSGRLKGLNTGKDMPAMIRLSEAIPKDQYEARLKADMVAMLTELLMDIEECVDGAEGSPQFEQGVTNARIQVVKMIQERIDNLIKEEIHNGYKIQRP